MKAHHPAACLAAAFVAWLAVSTAALADGPIVLRDVTKQTGIDFRHTDGSSGRRYFIEYIASGLATFDYDNDGRIDIYFLNGRALPVAKADVPAKNHLYRNLGGFRFEDVTEKAGVGDAGYGLGVCVGDYDNDGHADIYVSNFGPNVLYHNNGDGTFTDVTARAGVGRGEKKVGAGASFLDIDGDGNLDLFAANYVRFSFEANKPHYLMGTPTYPNPLDFPHDTNNLFHNNGDGTFADVSERSGIAAHPARDGNRLCRFRQPRQHRHLRRQRLDGQFPFPQRRPWQLRGSRRGFGRRVRRGRDSPRKHGGRLRRSAP